MRLDALPYRGGKSGRSKTGIGRWVASMLPWERNATYVEPFAGMLGVLLQRPRSWIEIVNDLDDRVVNWWRCLRDEPEELLRLMSFTPISRAEMKAAAVGVDDLTASPCQRAAHFSTLLSQSLDVQLSIKEPGKYWRRYLRGCAPTDRVALVDRLALVAERIRHLQIESCDAVDLLQGLTDHKRAIIYVDPPYGNLDGNYTCSVDKDALTGVLQPQRGKVAVSGYADDWDHLGWHRCEFATRTTFSVVAGSTPPRTEVLWLNYDPPQSALFDPA